MGGGLRRRGHAAAAFVGARRAGGADWAGRLGPPDLPGGPGRLPVGNGRATAHYAAEDHVDGADLRDDHLAADITADDDADAHLRADDNHHHDDVGNLLDCPIDYNDGDDNDDGDDNAHADLPGGCARVRRAPGLAAGDHHVDARDLSAQAFAETWGVARDTPVTKKPT
jgi:hypothetical protein